MTESVIKYGNDEEYRSTLLNYFSLSEYDEESIMEKTHLLFEKVKDIPVFQEKMRIAAQSMGCEDLEMGLIIMFSYEHFAELVSLLENHEIKLSV